MSVSTDVSTPIMELPTSDQIIEAIERFLARHGNMRPSRFGRDATGDANLIPALKAGAMPKLDRLHRIRDYMRAEDTKAGFDPDDVSAPVHADTVTTGEVAAS